MFTYLTKKAVTMLAVVFAIFLMGLASGTARATAYSFTGLAATCPFPPGECGTFVPGQPDNWGDFRNWSPQGVPSTGDTANIGSSTVKINGTRSVQSVTINGGNLTAGTLGVVGPSVSSWVSGTLNATLTVAVGGTLQISGSANHLFTSGVINNSGTVTWINDGAVFCSNNAVFNNKSGGVFNAQNNSDFIVFSTPQSTFNNQAGAIFNKSGAGTTTNFSTFFSNAGTVNGNSGTLNLGGGGTSSGTFTAANGARVNVSGALTGTFVPATGGVIGLQEGNNGASTLGVGAKFLGTGVTKVFSGTVSVTGAITTGQTGAPGTLEIEGGTLIGTASSSLASAGTGFYKWTGGTIGAAGSILNISASGQFQVAGSSIHSFTSGTVNNNGTATWIEDGPVFCSNNAVFNNKSGGVFNAQNNSDFIVFSTPQSTFNNLAGAVFNKTGAGTATNFSTLFSNAGTVNGNSGILNLGAGGTSSGTFTAANAARVNVSGALTGSFVPATGGVIGLQEGSNGATTLGVGTKFLGAGVTKVFNGNVKFIALIVAGDTGAPGTLELENGVFTGTAAGHLTTAGTGFINWTTGAISGIVNIDSGCQLRISGSGTHMFTSCTVNNSGVATWLNDGSIFSSDACVWNNKSGGVFNAQNNSDFIVFSTPQSTFNNQAGAVFNKTGAGTATNFSIAFNNIGTGLVNAQSGTVTLATGSSTAAFQSAAGAHVDFANDYIFNTGTKFRGTGCRVASGTVTFNGTVLVEDGGDFEIPTATAVGTSAGKLTTAGTGLYKWTGGTLGAEDSILNIGAGARFQISGSGIHSFSSGTFNNSGTVTWINDGAVFCSNNAIFNNQTGGVFNAQNNSDFIVFSTPQSNFNNLAGAIFNKTGAGTATNFSTLFNNTGTVNGTSGTLNIGGGGTSSGAFNAASGARVNVSGTLTGTFTPASGGTIGLQEPSGGATTLATGAKFLGVGLTKVFSGVVGLSGTVTVGQAGGPGNLVIEGGTLTGATTGHLTTTGTGLVNWTGGTFTGTVNIDSGCQFRISGSVNHFLTEGTVNNSGVATWLNDGSVLCSNASLWNNKSGGVFNALNNSDFAFFSSPQSTFDNEAGAIFNKSGAGTTSSFSTLITNAGNVNVNSGTLSWGADATQTAGATAISAGSTLGSTNFLLQGGQLKGKGAVNGNVTNSGGSVEPGFSPGQITETGNYIQGSGGKLVMELNGLTPATLHDQLKVIGTVALGGTLQVDFGFSPATGNTFTIIDNDGTDAVTGTFAGLANNATFVADGQLLRVSYNGGDGNDVVLTRLAPPTINIADATLIEGNTGTTNMVFTVTLSAALSQPVTVDFQTNEGTATAADFVGAGGTVTFAAGQTSKQILVAVQGDTLDENDETFTVTLSHPTVAQLGDSVATGTILDDDNPPALSISNVTVIEGSSGTTNAVFNVSLSTASGRNLTVKFATANGTATAPADYTTTAGTLTFTPGDTTETITVPVQGDLTDEVNETFAVNLSAAVNASIADGAGLGTIVDDDGPSIIINNPSQITEGNSGTTNAVFTVLLSAPSVQNVTVHFATADFTATAGEDYVAKSGTVTLTPGQTSAPITIAVNGDVVIEENEAFRVTISDAVNGFIVDGGAAAYIINDDGTAGLKRPRSNGIVLSSASANVATQTVTLNFTGKLPAEAADPSVWNVAVDAGAVEVQAASVQGNIVTLTLADGTLHTGDAVEVAWSGLPGVASGSVGPLRAR